ncbi:MAG: type IV pilus modification PilV family protein, partial [Solirubrobacteraceae bacterium]
MHKRPLDKREHGASEPPARAERARSRLAATTRSESGFSLIEVVISALLVGLIAIGTLTGFDSSSRATGAERAQNQATSLAAEDEERLRGLNVTELDQLGTSTKTVSDTGQCIEESSGAWRYCEGHAAYKRTTFTVKSSAQYVSAPTEGFTCETTGGAASYIQTTSTVTWPALGSRAPVTQSSIVNVPTSLTLLVKVWNQNHEGLSGAGVTVTNRARTLTRAEETTPTSGCVIFGALPEKEVDVVATGSGMVNEAEESVNSLATAPAKEVTLSASALTGPIEFTIATPGIISAEFESNGSKVGVKGDTFFATHTGVSKALVGGTSGSYASSATLNGLFPFATPGSKPNNPYTVYAGDCAANNAELVATTPKVKNPPAQVEPGGTTTVAVEVPAVNVTVYEGTETSKGALDSTAEAKV